ncbi:MAG: hypothetical protein ACOCVR_03615, partial [Myxococcota bacterium]
EKTMKEDHVIAAVHVTERLTRVPEVQKLLSDYGCNIKTRLGLHETGPDACSPNGLLISELVGDPSDCKALVDKLDAIEGVEAKSMTFKH